MNKMTDDFKPMPASNEHPTLYIIECIHGQLYAARTRKEWMAGIARRTLAWNKMHVRVDTVQNFCDDLSMAGQIVVRRTQ
jgi:hypothetical protein